MRQLPRLMLDTVGGFNPRICKRCDGETRELRFIYQVSIHASVKDATDSVLPKWLTYRVSIHASVKDATIRQSRISYLCMVSIHASVKDATDRMFYGCSKLGFNPRICKRCDQKCLHRSCLIHVSIHASVKDATLPFQKYHCQRMFQSTHL